jgi:RimJ/RimL family protein N-acetyltransferase
VTVEVRPGSRDHLVVAAGPRLRVRHKTLDDAIDDYSWRRDPENARLNGMQPFSEGFTRFLQVFEHDLAFVQPDRAQFAIEANDGAHIGSVMFYNADHGREAAEFGISIGDRRFRDSGLGREATVLFLRYAWQTYPFRSFYLHTLDWNERARRCFLAAGFNDVAVVERGGDRFVRMEARREWWLLWDMEGRFTTPMEPRPSAAPNVD